MGGRFSEAEWEDGERLGDEGRGGAGGALGDREKMRKVTLGEGR